MHAKVINAFWDKQDPKHTTYQVGDTFTGTAERIEGLAKAGFVKPLKSARPDKDELLHEIGEQKTNPELAEIAGVKPKKPAPRRKKV